MVVLVVPDRLEQGLAVKALLLLQGRNYLLVQQIRPLGQQKFLAVLGHHVRGHSLHGWRTNVKVHGLRPLNLVPRVSSDLFNCDSVRRVCNENFGNHVFRLLRQEVRKGILGVQDFLVEIRRLLVFERQITAQHRVKHDATTPKIAHQPVVLLSGYHLGSGIAWASAGCPQGLSLLIQVTKTEVNDLEGLVVVN